MAAVQIPRVVPVDEPAADLITRKRKLAMDIDLLAQLAHTAHVMETLPGVGHNAQQQQAHSAAASHGQGMTMTSDLAALSADTRAAKSSVGRSLESSRGTEVHAKQSKHKQAEQRRRERINERLAALRELVPHDTRSNTATFLEGVISYIQSLQQSNMALEAQLAALQGSKAAEGPRHAQKQQHQHSIPATSANAAETLDEILQQASLAAQLAQPCLSRVGCAGPMPGAAPPDAGSTPPSVDADLDRLTTGPAATTTSFSARPGTPYLPAELLPAVLTAAAGFSEQGPATHLQQHQQQPFQSSPTAAAATAYALAAAGGADLHSKPAVPAPAAPTAAALTAAVSPAPVTPTTAAAAAAQSTAYLAPVPALQLQPAQLQSVLERALVAALQQQAQQLASQFTQPNPEK